MDETEAWYNQVSPHLYSRSTPFFTSCLIGFIASPVAISYFLAASTGRSWVGEAQVNLANWTSLTIFNCSKLPDVETWVIGLRQGVHERETRWPGAAGGTFRAPGHFAKSKFLTKLSSSVKRGFKPYRTLTPSHHFPSAKLSIFLVHFGISQTKL